MEPNTSLGGDVETSGHAMLMYLLHKNKKLAHEKRMVEKNSSWLGGVY